MVHSRRDELIETLVQDGIFEAADDAFVLTTPFTEIRQTLRREARRSDGLDSPEWTAFLRDLPVDAEEVDQNVLADARAIHEMAGDIGPAAGLRAARAFDKSQLATSDPAVPDGFLRISGHEIQGFLERHSTAVVYCYRREDCDPCDLLKERFEFLIESGEVPVDIALAAVYGPESTEVLREDYQVSIAPTTLFCRNGTVDSRLIGDSGAESLVNELEFISEMDIDVDYDELSSRDVDSEQHPDADIDLD